MMLNLATVTYSQYVAGFDTPDVKMLAILLMLGALGIVFADYLKQRRFNRVVIQQHHSRRYFDVHEAYRRQLLKEDLKALF